MKFYVDPGLLKTIHSYLEDETQPFRLMLLAISYLYKDGLKYKTDVTSQGSYTTPLSTGGHSKPSPAPSCLPSSEDSNPEANVVLCTAELEACIESFLEEVEGDLELDDLPPLENITLLPVLVPTISGFVPFTVSTSQRCVPPKSLLRKVYHPYKDPVG